MASPPTKPPQKPGASARPGAAPGAKGDDALSRSRREKDALEGECHAVEEELEALKARYEQYFLGVEKREPARWREEVRKKVLRLKGAFTRNTGLKFRLQSLNARYLTYERLWLRGAREKEEGTYRRDVFKARLRARREGAAGAEAAARPASALPGPGPTAPAEAQAPAATVEPAAAATPVVPPAPPERPVPTPPPAAKSRPAAETARGALTDGQMRALYDAYRAAKVSCREDVSRLTYEAVARTVSKQLPELMARYKARAVEFKVEVKDGRAVLKAIPKV